MVNFISEHLAMTEAGIGREQCAESNLYLRLLCLPLHILSGHFAYAFYMSSGRPHCSHFCGLIYQWPCAFLIFGC